MYGKVMEGFISRCILCVILIIVYITITIICISIARTIIEISIILYHCINKL